MPVRFAAKGLELDLFSEALSGKVLSMSVRFATESVELLSEALSLVINNCNTSPKTTPFL